MKKLLFIAVVMAAVVGCKPEKGTYTISGNVAGVEGKVVMLDEYGSQIAESLSSDGKFSFSGNIEEPTPVLLSDGKEPFLLLFLEEGKIKVSGNIAEGGIRATGTISNDRSTRYDESYQEIMDRILSGGGKPDVDAFMAESRLLAEKAVDENLDNFFGIYMLSEVARQWEGAKVVEKLEQFPEELQQNRYAQKLREMTLSRMRTDTGQPFIEIALPDRTGNPVALSSLIGEGKYVLIDFWASWCAPCMTELPYLKATYDNYHERGFEIYGVSLDMGTEAWVNALESNDMKWVNVYHGPADSAAANSNTGVTDGNDKDDANGAEVVNVLDNNSDGGPSATPADSPEAPDSDIRATTMQNILSQYSITLIPTNFLIGPDGTIVAKNLRGAELQAFIADKLGTV